MEYMSFNRLFIAVSLICIFVIQRLVCLAHQATPLNLIKPIHDDINMENLAFVNHLQFIRSNYHRDDNNNDINNHNNNILNEIHQQQQQHQHHHPHHNYKNHHHQEQHHKHQQSASSPSLSSSSLSSEPSSVRLSYFPMSVLSFELNERQGCLEANNYSVIETFSAINKGEIVLKIRGFKIDLVLNSGATSGGSSFLKQDNKQNNGESSLYHQKNSAVEETIKYNNKNKQQQQQPMQNECHGHGFSIYDCEPFDIEPQHERRIRVGFSPDFTLTKYVAYLTLFTNLDFEYTIKLKASVPLPLVAACNQSLPRPDWEPTLRYIFPLGIMISIFVSIFMAYMKALNVKSQRVSANSASFNGQTNSHSNHHNGGSKDYDRSNNSSNNNNNHHQHHNGQHGVTSPISSSVLAHQHQHQNNSNTNNNSSFNGRNNSMNNNSKSNKSTNNNNSNQKRRKNSSLVNSEKVPNNNINNNNNSNKDNNNKSFATPSSSINQNNNDKKLSSPYAPIFQNLTNVIASPPPPLPTFENDFDSLEFKKLRSKKSSKKSNSLSGSIASNDDIGNPNSLCSSTNHMTSSLTSSSSSSSSYSTTSSSKSNNNNDNSNKRTNGKFSNIMKSNGGGSNNSSFNGESGRDCDLMQTSAAPLRDILNNNQIGNININKNNTNIIKQLNPINRKGSLRDVFNNAASLSDDDQETCQDFVKNTNKLYTKKSSSSLLSPSSMLKSSFLIDQTNNQQQIRLSHHQHQSSSLTTSQLFVTNGINSATSQLIDGVGSGSGVAASVTPIQPPSSLSSTPSSSVPSATSSTSSSPPLSASSYGEYSLLGPGATFELPCLRVRSTQLNTLSQ